MADSYCLPIENDIVLTNAQKTELSGKKLIKPGSARVASYSITSILGS